MVYPTSCFASSLVTGRCLVISSGVSLILPWIVLRLGLVTSNLVTTALVFIVWALVLVMALFTASEASNITTLSSLGSRSSLACKTRWSSTFLGLMSCPTTFVAGRRACVSVVSTTLPAECSGFHSIFACHQSSLLTPVPLGSSIIGPFQLPHDIRELTLENVDCACFVLGSVRPKIGLFLCACSMSHGDSCECFCYSCSNELIEHLSVNATVDVRSVSVGRVVD
ncbi:hypothetical protein Tco_1252757 [Tanacetum coccineum]